MANVTESRQWIREVIEDWKGLVVHANNLTADVELDRILTIGEVSLKQYREIQEILDTHIPALQMDPEKVHYVQEEIACRRVIVRLANFVALATAVNEVYDIADIFIKFLVVGSKFRDPMELMEFARGFEKDQFKYKKLFCDLEILQEAHNSMFDALTRFDQSYVA